MHTHWPYVGRDFLLASNWNLDKNKKMSETCKICFGSGYLIYCIVPPKLCPRCKGKGIIKTKTEKNNSPFYWIKLIRRKSLMSSSRFMLGWFSIIGIILFSVMLIAISYVWVFVKWNTTQNITDGSLFFNVMELISYNLYCLFSKMTWELSIFLIVLGAVFGYILHLALTKWNTT